MRACRWRDALATVLTGLVATAVSGCEPDLSPMPGPTSDAACTRVPSTVMFSCMAQCMCTLGSATLGPHVETATVCGDANASTVQWAPPMGPGTSCFESNKAGEVTGCAASSCSQKRDGSGSAEVCTYTTQCP